jgi:predicted methyltransferase
MRNGIRFGLIAAVAATALLSGSAYAAPAKPASAQAIAAAIAAPGRPEADMKQDASRKPAALLAFMKIAPGGSVADIWPGRGYWTRLFSALVGPKGHVISYVPSEIADLKSKPVEIAEATAKEPGLGNVIAYSDPLAAPIKPEHANTLDVAWTFENYHDLHNPILKGASVEAFNKQVFARLKPGGYYIIGDHAAPPGTGLTATNTLHRIDPAALKAEILKAGFVFDGESKVLARPADPKTANVFDAAIRGETDRFIYRFRKPLSK